MHNLTSLACNKRKKAIFAQKTLNSIRDQLDTSLRFMFDGNSN